MPLPVVKIVITPILIKIKSAILSSGVVNAWKAGGLLGLGKYLLIQGINLIKKYFNPRRIAGFLQDAKNYLWNFNWNITDEQIEQEVNRSIQNLKNLAGDEFVRVLRNSLGIIIFRNRLPRSPSELILGQIVEAIETLADETIRTAGTILFLKGYKALRSWLKRSGIAQAILGAELAEAWGRRGGVLSFSRLFERIVRSIPLPPSGDIPQLPPGRGSEIIIVDDNNCDSIDLGELTILKIVPNREVPEDFTYLYTYEKLLPQSTTLLLAQNQLIGNRDVGVIVGGQPSSEYSYERDPRQITVVFEYAPNPNKPYFKLPRNQKTSRPRTIIANVKRSELVWETLLQAAGGTDGYMYGRERMTYKLISESGGNRGEITVWAETEQAAQARCDAFLALTDSILKSVNPGRQIEGGNRQESRNNLKEVRRVYPYRCTILVGVDSTVSRSGRSRLTSPQGQYVQRKAVFTLRGNDPPPRFAEEVDRLFSLMQGN